MKIQIKKDHPNKTVNRREIELEVTGNQTTPSRKELLEQIASELGQKPEQLAILKIEQQFGTQTNRVWVHSYADAKIRQRFELSTITGRDLAAKVTPDARKKIEQARQAKKDAGKPKDAAPAAAEKK